MLDNGVQRYHYLEKKENNFQKINLFIQSDLEISKRKYYPVYKNNQTIYTMGTPTSQDKAGNFLSYSI